MIDHAIGIVRGYLAPVVTGLAHTPPLMAAGSKLLTKLT